MLELKNKGVDVFESGMEMGDLVKSV